METKQLNDTNYHLHTPEAYRKAIAALETSTRAIESQISISRQFLHTITTPKQHKFRPNTHGKHQALLSQISSQHTTLAQTLTATSANLKKAVASTLITVDDTLSRDDYTFEQIAQGLKGGDAGAAGVNGDGVDDGDEDATQTRTDKLLDALIRTESEVIRTRLERVYLEVLNTATPGTNGTYTHDDEHDQELDLDSPRYVDSTKTDILKADLRTLYTEIDDVTAMFVAHEHGDILNQLDEDVARTRRVLSVRQCEWAVGRIEEMTERLRGIEEGCKGVQGQRIVVRRLSGYLGELSVQSGMDVGVGVGRGGGRSDIGVVRKEADGPALVGLRGYLGVGAAGGAGRGRVDEVFRDVKRSVEGVLDVQGEQAGTLRNTGGVNDGEQGEEDFARGYGSMLNELDEEIAKVKESIEALPG